ncbi:MAG: hypothetical protein V4673_05895 [Pseudomonadota bacterium]
MTLLEDRTAVFIVRIWCERGDGPSVAPEWRGSVEHVQTGARAFFRHLDVVLEFMKPHLEGIGIDAQQRFWERISTVMDDAPDPAFEGRDPDEIRFDFGIGSGAAPDAHTHIPASASATAAAAVNARKSR